MLLYVVFFVVRSDIAWLQSASKSGHGQRFRRDGAVVYREPNNAIRLFVEVGVRCEK